MLIFLVFEVYAEPLVDEGLVFLVEQVVDQVYLHKRFAFFYAIDETKKLLAEEEALQVQDV